MIFFIDLRMCTNLRADKPWKSTTMDEGESVTVKTAFQMIDATTNGRISREDFEKFAAHKRDNVRQLNPMEAVRTCTKVSWRSVTYLAWINLQGTVG